MSDVRCRSCCGRTKWWYIYIYVFVIIVFAGLMYALSELLKGAGLVSQVNRGSCLAPLHTDTHFY